MEDINMEPYFLDDDYPEIVVALKRESKRIPGQHDRVIWCKSEKRFIYGDINSYMVYHGDEIEPRLDIQESTQKLIKDCYKTGLTQCGSSFYDDADGRLYEVKDIGSEHILIFDANALTE